MPNIINFNFENATVRTALKGNEPFFCLPDVCEILELDRTSSLIRKLDEKGIAKIAINTKGGQQEVTFINEPNLYRVIFRSNKAEAVKFQNWVFDEVLPSIRKNGAYQQQNLAITHQSERPFNIGDYLNPKVNQIMDYVHDLEHIVFNTTGKYPQRPFKPDEIAKGIIGYCLRNQSIELSFSERGLGFNLVDRTMLRIHDSNIAEHIKNGNVKKQYLDEIIQASVARLA